MGRRANCRDCCTYGCCDNIIVPGVYNPYFNFDGHLYLYPVSQRMPKTIAVTFSGIVDGKITVPPAIFGPPPPQPPPSATQWSALNGTWTLKRSSACCYSAQGPKVNGVQTTITFCYTGIPEVNGECEGPGFNGGIGEAPSQCVAKQGYSFSTQFTNTIEISIPGGWAVGTDLIWSDYYYRTLTGSVEAGAYYGSWDAVFTLDNYCLWLALQQDGFNNPIQPEPCGAPFTNWVINGKPSGNQNNCGCKGLCGQDSDGNQIDPGYVDFGGATAVPVPPVPSSGQCNGPGITKLSMAAATLTTNASSPCSFAYIAGAWNGNIDEPIYCADAINYSAFVQGQTLTFTGKYSPIGCAVCYPSGTWTCQFPKGTIACGQTFTLTSATVVVAGVDYTPGPITLTFPPAP